MSNKKYIQKTLDLASKGKGKTSPNPLVGAVLVKGNKIIAQGYHKKAGTPHAEVIAIKKAGKMAKGSTLYVSLEPCCHTDKLTPPCTSLIIESGIKKVVVAMTDPNPKVAGKGLKELRKAGIETETGILENEAKKLNEVFSKFIIKNEPFVILKIAQSLDGKIATSKGESQWITGPDARERVHSLRNDIDALLVGIGTVQKDNPSLDCRMKNGVNPFRVIVDSSLKIPLKSKVLGYGDNKTIIATTGRTDKKKINKLVSMGAIVLVVKEKAGRVSLKHLMKALAGLKITSVMIEGGSSIAASAISEKIVDKVMFFVAPKIIGGDDSYSSIGGKSPARLKKALQLIDFRAVKYGDDVLLEGYPNY